MGGAMAPARLPLVPSHVKANGRNASNSAIVTLERVLGNEFVGELAADSRPVEFL